MDALRRLDLSAGKLLLALPLLIVGGLVGLAFVLLAVDRSAGTAGVGFAFGGGASAARTVLSTIATSLITVTGLSFSVTVVTLQLVSSQFSPRAVRGFLLDRVNRSAVAALVGIFVYCLIVLASIRDAGGPPGSALAQTSPSFVPRLSVTVAILLAVIGLGVLVAFIAHIATTSQVSHFARRLSRSTMQAIDRLYPDAYGEAVGESGDALLAQWRAARPGRELCAADDGYVRTIDIEALIGALAPGDRLALRVWPGQFVTRQIPVMEVWSDAPEPQARALIDAVRTDGERDLAQDADFGVRQLADIALRAVSPGINDPTTAVTCIGHLRAILERLAARRFPPEVREVPERAVCLIVPRPDFHHYVSGAVLELGRYAAGDARVSGAALDALAAVAWVARRSGAPERAEIAGRAARRIAESAIAAAANPEDAAQLRAKLTAVGADRAPRPHDPAITGLEGGQ